MSSIGIPRDRPMLRIVRNTSAKHDLANTPTSYYYHEAQSEVSDVAHGIVCGEGRLSHRRTEI